MIPSHDSPFISAAGGLATSTKSSLNFTPAVPLNLFLIKIPSFHNLVDDMVLPMLLELLDSIIFQSIVTVALCLGAYAYLFRYIIRRRPDPGDLDKITQFDDCENVQLE